MKVAIYGKKFDNTFNNSITELFEILKSNNVAITIHKPFYEFINNRIKINIKNLSFFTNTEDIKRDFNILLKDAKRSF